MLFKEFNIEDTGNLINLMIFKRKDGLEINRFANNVDITIPLFILPLFPPKIYIIPALLDQEII